MDSDMAGGRPLRAWVLPALIVLAVAVTGGWGWSRIPQSGVLITFNLPGTEVAYAAPTNPSAAPPDGVPVRQAASTAVPAAVPAPVERPVLRASSPQLSGRRAAVPAIVVQKNWLSETDVGLGVHVGVYTDCSGKAPLPRGEAEIYSCAPAGVLAILGHNPGIFSPLVRARVGEAVEYRDPAGQRSAYRISEIHRVNRSETMQYVGDGSHPHMVLVTCAVPDGSIDWIYVAEPTG